MQICVDVFLNSPSLRQTIGDVGDQVFHVGFPEELFLSFVHRLQRSYDSETDSARRMVRQPPGTLGDVRIAFVPRVVVRTHSRRRAAAIGVVIMHEEPVEILAVVVVTGVILYRHKSNIGRLLSGNELKVG